MSSESDERWAAYPDGLKYGTVRLIATPVEWSDTAARVAAEVRIALGNDAVAVSILAQRQSRAS